MFEDEEAIPTEGERLSSPGAMYDPAAMDVPASEETQEPAQAAIPEDDASAIPLYRGARRPEPQAQQQGGVADILQQGGVGPQGPIRRIIGYLMGDEAAPPQEVTAAGAAVDPSGQTPASTRNVLAVERAAREGGAEAAWKLVQGNRVAFNAKQAFGYTALNGTPQKPPDLNAAIDAANQAQAHILDGSEVQFAPAQGGVTATVIGDGGQPQRIPMSIDQFRAYLNVGGEGQWDKLMEHGVPAAIKKLATGQTTRVGQLQPMQRPAPRPAPQQEEAIPTTEPAQESTVEKKQDRVMPDRDNQLLEQGRRIFPWASQSQGREAWIAGQQGREAEMRNKRDVARETGLYRVDAAEARARGNVQQQQLKNEGGVAIQQEKNKGWQYASDAKLKAAQANVEMQLRKQQDSNANQAQTRALKAIQTKLANFVDLTPQEQSYLDSLPEAGNAGAGVTQPGARPQGQPAPSGNRTQPSASPGQPPVPGAKFYKGNWYTRGPNGESVPVR